MFLLARIFLNVLYTYHIANVLRPITGAWSYKRLCSFQETSSFAFALYSLWDILTLHWFSWKKITTTRFSRLKNLRLCRYKEFSFGILACCGRRRILRYTGCVFRDGNTNLPCRFRNDKLWHKYISGTRRYF